jgi:iron-sulfur cluster assembly accessory protein
MEMTTTTVPVLFTAGAVKAIQKLQKGDPSASNKVLRVGVKGGGCSGMTYVLEFDTPTEKDIHFSIEGIPCVMDRSHEIYLLGMEIDWQDGLQNRGFTFTNPNASKTCGCGTSFAV